MIICALDKPMSIGNNRERRKEAFFAWSSSDRGVTSAFIIIASTLLLAGGDFVLLSPTLMTTAAAFAQEEGNNTTTAGTATTTNYTATTTGTMPSPSSGLELSAQPVWVEHAAITGVTPINETHSSVTYSGNGTLTLPNTTQTINTTNNGSALASIATESGQGKMTIRTQDGEETATVTFYEIDRHPDTTTGEGKGIVIAVINTNTTSGMLAPLNGMIVVGINEFQTSTGEGRFTLWEWKS
jgi:hypothetical protein